MIVDKMMLHLKITIVLHLKITIDNLPTKNGDFHIQPLGCSNVLRTGKFLTIFPRFSSTNEAWAMASSLRREKLPEGTRTWNDLLILWPWEWNIMGIHLTKYRDFGWDYTEEQWGLTTHYKWWFPARKMGDPQARWMVLVGKIPPKYEWWLGVPLWLRKPPDHYSES